MANTELGDHPCVKAQACFKFLIAEYCEERAVLFNAKVGQ